MRFGIRFTEEAQRDLKRFYDWMLQRAQGDYTAAERALQAIHDGITVLALAPLGCRKATVHDQFLLEMVVGFGASGYVLLSEVQDSRTVTVLAVRHQREDDYH
ncbi:type II toxin-antitoxin system RelE/ParE family toxin [Luteimonas sp. Y-2-2-4F]|nr:type II toxin-antitoxin system RelE/ParE family toxin [Luteimonas sp. Y-2-2-4F]